MRRVVLFLACVLGVVLMTGGVASASSCEINSGDALTNDPNLKVSYQATAYLSIEKNTEFRYDSKALGILSSVAWQPVPPDETSGLGNWHSFVWNITPTDGEHTIYMEFRTSKDDLWIDKCSASIVYDGTGPRGYVSSTTVRRGKVCTVRFSLTDSFGASVASSISVSKLTGRIMKTAPVFIVANGSWQTWRFRCRLAKGRYRIAVGGEDAAGNTASSVAHAILRVR
jgi:hypothetical protein